MASPTVECIYTWAKSQLEERKDGISSIEVHDSVVATEGVGLEGDRYAKRVGLYSDYHASCPEKGGWQQVTLFDMAQFEEICGKARMRAAKLSVPSLRRNIGIRCPPATNILSWVGHEIVIGTTVLFVHMHGNPCPHLEKTLKAAGFQEAAWELCGVHAEVVHTGTVTRGDTVEVRAQYQPERIVGPSLLRARINGSLLRPSLRTQLVPDLVSTVTESSTGYVQPCHYADPTAGHLGSWPPNAAPPAKGPIALAIANANERRREPTTTGLLSYVSLAMAGVVLVSAAAMLLMFPRLLGAVT